MTYRDSIKLRKMANSWKDIKKDLESHLYVMFEHLVKVYYYHNYEEYLQGWIASIRKGFEHIKKQEYRSARIYKRRNGKRNVG